MSSEPREEFNFPSTLAEMVGPPEPGEMEWCELQQEKLKTKELRGEVQCLAEACSKMQAERDAAVKRAERAESFAPNSPLHILFHRAWTQSVGTEGYDKRQWVAVEAALQNA